MHEIMSTEWCYRGYSHKEECYVNGDYSGLYDAEDVQDDTIEWSLDSWEDEKEYFLDYLRKEMAAYERRYRTTVTHIGMIGSVGVWTGNHVGGKLIRHDENPLDHMGRVDIVRVHLDSDNTLRIDGVHHDGTHCMTIHFLTENKLSKMAPSVLEWSDDYSADDIINIHNNDKAFKVSRIFDEYFSRPEVAAA